MCTKGKVDKQKEIRKFQHTKIMRENNLNNQLNKSDQKNIKWYAKKYSLNKNMEKAKKHCKVDMYSNCFLISILYR